jgi:flavin-dependent thymidylate synthase
MRYCNYGKRGLQVICPPSIGVQPGEYNPEVCDFERFGMHNSMIPLSIKQRRWMDDKQRSYQEYLYELTDGVPPEDARFSLPIATKTEVVTTFNLRMWRHVIRDRALNPKAQWEIRGIFNGIYEDLLERLPAVFGDLA